MRISALAGTGLAAALSIGLAGEASAGGRFGHGFGGGGHHQHGPRQFGYRHRGYPPAFVAPYGFGYGYSDVVMDGDYLGAPYTRFPRPSEIVPPAWGHGTYGIPTVTGIRPAPVAQPTLYVIESAAPSQSAMGGGQAGSRVISTNGNGTWSNVPEQGTSVKASGASIVSVTVPRR